jgi:SRSO17 transposase
MRQDEFEILEEHWSLGFADVSRLLAPLFRRSEARDIASGYLRGLLSCVERKNGWQLSESVGESTPYAIQHLLDRCLWDADSLRDELQLYVSEHLAAPDGIAILDETGFLKKGTHSAGVQRQYSGTAGRVENCQIGVFLAYASSRGRTFIDRALYVPKTWADDKARREKVRIPQELCFATKPQLGIAMLKRAFASNIPISWVTGDCVYGGDFGLRNFLAGQKQPYVLMVQSNHQIYLGFNGLKVKELISEYKLSWQRKSCGDGSKGQRIYDWALVPLQYDAPEEMQHFVLFRRNLSDENEIAYYLVLAKTCASFQEIVNVAGSRWAIEESFQVAKSEVGLDQYEVRSWHGWHRHITLAMVAHAFLTIQRAKSLAEKKESRQFDDPIDCTRNKEAYISTYVSDAAASKRSNIPLVTLATKTSSKGKETSL